MRKTREGWEERPFPKSHLACEQALLFGRAERASRERASEERDSLRSPK